MEEENQEDMIDLALMSNSINLTAAKSGDGAFGNTTINLSDDPLVMFSRERITKNQSINMPGLRDYAELNPCHDGCRSSDAPIT